MSTRTYLLQHRSRAGVSEGGWRGMVGEKGKAGQA